MIAMPKLKESHDAYIEKVVASGKKITFYDCPNCDETIATPAAPVGEKWDTLSTCYACGGTHFKLTDGNKAVGVEI